MALKVKNETHSGFCLIHKPKGMSSFRALYPLKRLFKGYKVGHTGTLDPDATGLLIAAVGSATRLIEFIQDLPKTYRFDVIPGIVTDSYDMSGNVLERNDISAISEEVIKKKLNFFLGTFPQYPPIFSAIKIKGKRACDRVRLGERIEVKSRNITVYSWEICSIQPDRWTFEVHCSKGTYVRSLGHDLGKALGCGGAVDNIFRWKIGDYSCEKAMTLEELEDGENINLMPLKNAVQHLPQFCVNAKGKSIIGNGNKLPLKEYKKISDGYHTEKGSSYVCIVDEEGQLLALGYVDDSDFLCPQRVLVPHE